MLHSTHKQTGVASAGSEGGTSCWRRRSRGAVLVEIFKSQKFLKERNLLSLLCSNYREDVWVCCGQRGSRGAVLVKKILKSQKSSKARNLLNLMYNLYWKFLKTILMRATRITRGSHGKIILKSQKFSKVGSLPNVLYSITIEKTFENVLDAGDEDVYTKSLYNWLLTLF